MTGAAELLVSAAAGSGKTRVLVERLLDRVTGEGAGHRPTFWSSPIPRRPRQSCGPGSPRSCPTGWPSGPTTGTCGGRPRWSTRPRSPRSTPSVPLCCGRAATCSDLDPDFRLCDEGEGAGPDGPGAGGGAGPPVRGSGPGGATLPPLVDTLAAGRDDSRLEQIVLDVFGRIQSHPDPAGWLAEQSRPVGAGGGHRRGARPPGGRCCWPTPGGRASAAWSCCSGRWNCTGRDERAAARITAPVSAQSIQGVRGPAGGGQLGRRVPGPASGVPGGGAEESGVEVSPGGAAERVSR